MTKIKLNEKLNKELQKIIKLQKKIRIYNYGRII